MTVEQMLESHRDEIIELYSSGMPTMKICEKYKVNHKFIYNILKNSGIQMRRKHGKMEQNKEQMFLLFDEGLSILEIAKKLNLPKTSVCRFLNNNGKNTDRYIKRCDIPLKDFLQEIIEEYNSGVGCTTLSKKYGCSEQSILQLLKRNKIDTSFVAKWDYDKEVFSKITTEGAAWMLGVMYTDGNNGGDSIRAVMTDLDIIQKMKRVINYNGPIVEKALRGKMKKIQYLISVCGQDISNQFTKLGCMPNKTFILNFPNEDILPRNLHKHFVRGLIDGDGSVGNYVSLAGASPMLLQFPDIVKTHIDIDFIRYDNTNFVNGVCYSQRITHREDVKKFLHWIYDDATIYGDRKRANAEIIFNKPDLPKKR